MNKRKKHAGRRAFLCCLLFDVNGARREGEGGAGVFDDAADLVVDALAHFEVLVLVRGLREIENVDVLAELAEFLEDDGDDRVVDLGVRLEERA